MPDPSVPRPAGGTCRICGDPLGDFYVVSGGAAFCAEHPIQMFSVLRSDDHNWLTWLEGYREAGGWDDGFYRGVLAGELVEDYESGIAPRECYEQHEADSD